MTCDAIDIGILNELQNDGRASMRSLADELEVSVTTISNRLEELEAAGVIRGYCPVLGYDQLGFDVTAIIQLKVEGDAIYDISNELREKNKMLTVYEVTGDFDIIAIGKFADTDDMNDHIKDLLIKPSILETNTSIVLNVISENASIELSIPEGETA